jgi:hypothetical protein
MRIELYLRDVMQDFPDDKYCLSKYSEKSNNWNDSPPWYNPWTNNPWYQTMDSRMLFDSQKASHEVTERLKIRREEFGGLLFDPLTAAVYKADAEACNFIELVKAGDIPDEAGRKMKLQQDQLMDFMKQLEKLGLWLK